MVEEKDGSERTFHVGDCVVIESEVEGFPWIAQVVELYEIGYAQDDDEIQFVGEDMKLAQARMQCTLRWFYYACDKSLKESQRFNKHLPGPVKDEMYFSDHVEVDGNNVVDVIEGLAHMCSSRATMRAMKRDKPRNFCDGDEIRIVRCFYGYGKENPAPIRELDTGELSFLLSNPSTKQNMYNSSRPVMLGSRASAIKGTGRSSRYSSATMKGAENSH